MSERERGEETKRREKHREEKKDDPPASETEERRLREKGSVLLYSYLYSGSITPRARKSEGRK